MNHPTDSRALDAGTPEPPSELAGRIFIIACSFGMAVGSSRPQGCCSQPSRSRPPGTFVVPLVATFEGFHDPGGSNAVAVSGPWVMAGAATIALALFLSFFTFRRFDLRRRLGVRLVAAPRALLARSH